MAPPIIDQRVAAAKLSGAEGSPADGAAFDLARRYDLMMDAFDPAPDLMAERRLDRYFAHGLALFDELRIQARIGEQRPAEAKLPLISDA